MSNPGAIITGGASGIGLALTKHLLSQGWSVVIADINPSGAIVAESLGENALWVNTDVTHWESQVALFEKAFAWNPRIVFLAANAGTTTYRASSADISTSGTAPTSLMDLNAEKPSLRVLDINFLGVIYSTKLFLHHINRQDPSPPKADVIKARVVITGSQAGFYAFPYDPMYCASKHALVGLSRSLGPAYAKLHGITVNLINPGFIKTPLTAVVHAVTPGQYETPLSTMIGVFDDLLHSRKTGQVVEVSGQSIYYQKQQAYPDDISRWLSEQAPPIWASAV